MANPKGLEHATRVKAYSFAPEDLVIIGLDTEDGPEHPDYDPRIKLPIREATVKNIMRFGVLQPINVAVVDGIPVVVDGRQRVRHAREANKRLAEAGEENLIKVQCKNIQHHDADKRSLIGITTNTHRTNDNPVMEARKAEALKDRGTDDGDICNAFGWSIGTLRNRRKLLELAPAVLKMVEQGRLSVSAALELHGATPETQVSRAEKISQLPKRGQTNAAKSAANSRERSNNVEETDYERPGIRMLTKVLQANDTDELGLSDEVIRTIRWVLGTGSPSVVRGLSACINKVNSAKAEAAAKRAKKKPPTNRNDKKGATA